MKIKHLILAILPFVLLFVGFAKSPFFTDYSESNFWFFPTQLMVVSGVLLFFMNCVKGLYADVINWINKLYED